MKKAIFIVFVFSVSCAGSRNSIQKTKEFYGDFNEKTIQLRPLDYTKAPINKAIEHHPENYAYLEDVDLFSMAHLSDKLFITGFVVQPREQGNYPVIVFNRGGNRDYGKLLVTTAVEVMAPLAAQGYVVVATNYRGNSRSEGAEQFGGSDVNDICNLITSLGELEMADTSRIGLLGVSRGAMMNFLVLKNHKCNHIKTAVNIGGISDLELTIKHHPQIEQVAIDLIPEFEANRTEELRKRSAVYWTSELPKSTPLLLLHSYDDQHVHYDQIPPLADSLDNYQVPYRLISFKNDNHGIRNHAALVEEILAEWFDSYLRKDDPFSVANKREIVE